MCGISSTPALISFFSLFPVVTLGKHFAWAFAFFFVIITHLPPLLFPFFVVLSFGVFLCSSGQCLHTFAEHTAPIRSLHVSPATTGELSGGIYSIGEDNAVCLYSVSRMQWYDCQ